MLEKKKMLEISKNLIADKNDFMSAFRKNIFMYLKEKDLTINELSELADVPYATLKNFLYTNSKDANLSNAVKLSRALDVSVDELIGAETLTKLTRERIAMCRELPENDLYVVQWFIRYLYEKNINLEPNKRYVSVMEVSCNHHGNLGLTNNYRKMDITDINEQIRNIIFFGIAMPCEHYMPYYSPYDILLIANDRKGNIRDDVLIRIGKFLYIARRKEENGIVNYHSIFDGKYWMNEKEADEEIGYVAYVKTK